MDHLFVFFSCSFVFFNHISAVIVRVLRLKCGKTWVRAQSGQTKMHNIDICCFIAKYAALWRNSKHWLARNQDHASERSDRSTRGLLVQ